MKRKKTLKHKGREILKSREHHHFPDYDIFNYQLDLVKNLNYYNVEVDPKKKQNWAIAYWKKLGKKVTNFSSVRSEYFAQVGALIHMITNRGLTISVSHTKYIDSAYAKISDLASKIVLDDTKPKNLPNIQERISQIASNHIGEIEGMIDDYIWNKGDLEVSKYLSQNFVKVPIVKLIHAHFKNKMDSFNSELEDDTKGYSSKVARKLDSALREVVSQCVKAEAVGNVVRAPKKRKPQPPSKIVSKLKYLLRDDTLNLISVNPEKILTSTEVWFIDTARRRLVKFESIDGMLLTVKGRSIINFDPEKSGSKILRKPETQLQGISNFTKRPMNELYNGVKAIVGKVGSGRINEKMLLLKCFN